MATTRLTLSATPGRPYAAFVAKELYVAYSLFDFTARTKTFAFTAIERAFDFAARLKTFVTTANTGPK